MAPSMRSVNAAVAGMAASKANPNRSSATVFFLGAERSAVVLVRGAEDEAGKCRRKVGDHAKKRCHLELLSGEVRMGV